MGGCWFDLGGISQPGGSQGIGVRTESKGGGLFNSFRMDGFQFDGGIKGVENSDVMMPMLAQLGLLERITFKPSPISQDDRLHQPD